MIHMYSEGILEDPYQTLLKEMARMLLLYIAYNILPTHIFFCWAYVSLCIIPLKHQSLDLLWYQIYLDLSIYICSTFFIALSSSICMQQTTLSKALLLRPIALAATFKLSTQSWSIDTIATTMAFLAMRLSFPHPYLRFFQVATTLSHTL